MKDFSGLRIAAWPHWFHPSYKLADYLKEKFGRQVDDVNYRVRGYLDNYDVVIMEQNGFDDYLENDWEYFQKFVERGGICWILHQDYRRWTPTVIPLELGRPYVTYRYVPTIAAENWSYLLPKIEKAGIGIFGTPNYIDLDDMVYWKMPGNTFDMHTTGKEPETIYSAALSCVVNCDKWEILGSFKDTVVKDGALVLKANYGKGMFFWSQMLFPEVRIEESDPIMGFWGKFTENVLVSFQDFLGGVKPVEMPVRGPKPLAVKNNYRMIIHLHSLDWYGADAGPNDIAAAMKYHGFDIGILAVKDGYQIDYAQNFDDINDERVMLIPGQEFHPFNFEDPNLHNSHHILSMGVSNYAPEFTRSLFDLEDVDKYTREAIEFTHANGGLACATHPYFDYWKNYNYDGVDINYDKDLKTLSGSDIERFYLGGGRITATASVDMWGVKRLFDNPMFGFIYVDGTPTKESVLAAIKAGHLMPALKFKEADVRLGKYLPGDQIPAAEVAGLTLKIAVEANAELRELRVFNGAELLCQEKLAGGKIFKKELSLAGTKINGFVRVEVTGNDGAMLISNPFFCEARKMGLNKAKTSCPSLI